MSTPRLEPRSTSSRASRSLVALDDEVRGADRVVAQKEEVEIPLGDRSGGEELVAHPVDEPTQKDESYSTTGYFADFPVWIRTSTSKSSSSVPIPPGMTTKPSAGFTKQTLRA